MTQAPAYHRGGLGSVPDWSACYFWWAEWQSYRVFCPGVVRVVFLVGRMAKLQGFLSRAGPRGISGGQSGKVIGFSVPDWSAWYFWWAEWQNYRGFSEYFGFFASAPKSYSPYTNLTGRTRGRNLQNFKHCNVFQRGNMKYRRSLERKLCSDRHSSENQITI